MTREEQRIKVLMLGLRGFPNVQGGVEVHVENLAQALNKLDCDVGVIVRTSYIPKRLGDSWNGIHYHRIWAPSLKGVETFIHSLLGVFYAAIKRPDILHMHGIGPGIFTPLARLLGLKVVLTHHSQNYDHEKWGGFSKWLLKLGEKYSVKYSNEMIAVSKVIKDSVLANYNREILVINNGVNVQKTLSSDGALQKFGLVRNKYVLSVGRLVQEKRHMDLINAFLQLSNTDEFRLVVVGGSDYKDSYYDELGKVVSKSSNIIMTGYLGGRELVEIFSHARLFVLSSSSEGQPIALLEALSYGLPVIASDIPANRELNLGANHYYELGNIDKLTDLIEKQLKESVDIKEREENIIYIKTNYDWNNIATKTVAVYKGIIKKY